MKRVHRWFGKVQKILPFVSSVLYSMHRLYPLPLSSNVLKKLRIFFTITLRSKYRESRRTSTVPNHSRPFKIISTIQKALQCIEDTLAVWIEQLSNPFLMICTDYGMSDKSFKGRKWINYHIYHSMNYTIILRVNLLPSLLFRE